MTMDNMKTLQTPLESIQLVGSQTSLNELPQVLIAPAKRSKLFRFFAFLGFQKGYNVPLC